MINTTQIERIAALYGCTIIGHTSGTLSGIYAAYKGAEERLATWQEAQSITLTQIHEVCQRLSGRQIKDFWGEIKS
jgi:hypothetical protein